MPQGEACGEVVDLRQLYSQKYGTSSAALQKRQPPLSGTGSLEPCQLPSGRGQRVAGARHSCVLASQIGFSSVYTRPPTPKRGHFFAVTSWLVCLCSMVLPVHGTQKVHNDTLWQWPQPQHQHQQSLSCRGDDGCELEGWCLSLARLHGELSLLPCCTWLWFVFFGWALHSPPSTLLQTSTTLVYVRNMLSYCCPVAGNAL